MCSIQALEGKLTADEEARIIDAMERAEMENAANLIGQAMLRP